MDEGDRQEPETYRAWMLRLWQADTGHGMAWHASLQSAHSDERRGFENIEQLWAYLQAWAGLRQKHHPGQKEGRD